MHFLFVQLLLTNINGCISGSTGIDGGSTNCNEINELAHQELVTLYQNKICLKERYIFDMENIYF